jgi:signal transduction histidine kinase
MTVPLWRRVPPHWAARAAGLAAGMAGALALTGALLELPGLAALWPDQPAIKANTALAFVLSGVSVWLSAGRQPGAGARLAARISAAAVAGVGLLSLLQHVSSWSPGIDQLLVHDAEGIVAGAPSGRMSPIAALNFVLLGAALLLLDARTPGGRALPPLLVAPAALLALLALVGHLHGTSFFQGISRHAAMRLPVTLQFLLLCGAIVAARPDRGPLVLLGSDSAGGVLARRLLWVALLTPLVLGGAAVMGRRAGLYDADFGSALIVSGSVLTLGAAVAWSAWVLHRNDEDRLASRVHALAAQEALEQRDEFLMVAAHELYSPISSLQLMVEALERGMATSADETNRCLTNVGRQAQRLTKLVEELLDVSRLERGQLHLQLETVDLSEVARSVVDRFALPLARAGCVMTLAATEPVQGWWDRRRLEQVVGNLLSNAVKFGAGRPIEVCVEQRGPNASLVVRDRGLGIPPDRVAHIFERFERAVSVQQYGGLGVGLYLVRGIVQALGGAIAVDSAPARGATFTMTLPRSGPPLPRRPAALTAGIETT